MLLGSGIRLFESGKYEINLRLLNTQSSFIPELSLVAVEDEQIVGYILFTQAAVNGIEVLALAPLSVLPKYQNRGIGQSLIKQGHIIAQKMGVQVFCCFMA